MIQEYDFKALLDCFDELGLCDKSDNISDEVDAMYGFKTPNNWLETNKRVFDILPDNWGVRYYESESDDDVSGITLVRYFTRAEIEAKTNI